MSISDPIADMLTRIRNANTAKHDTVDIPASKMKQAIADILLKEGYVKAVDVVTENDRATIRITLKYGADKNEKVIKGLKRISKPGLRVYSDAANLPKVLGGLGTLEQQSFQQTRVYLQIRKQEKRTLVAKFLHSFGNQSRKYFSYGSKAAVGKIINTNTAYNAA